MPLDNIQLNFSMFVFVPYLFERCIICLLALPLLLAHSNTLPIQIHAGNTDGIMNIYSDLCSVLSMT